MIIAVDDVFVVPIPTTMKAVGFFRAAGNAAIAPEAREDVIRRIRNAASGWNAVAVGARGRPGLMLKAAKRRSTAGHHMPCTGGDLLLSGAAQGGM